VQGESELETVGVVVGVDGAEITSLTPVVEGIDTVGVDTVGVAGVDGADTVGVDGVDGADTVGVDGVDTDGVEESVSEDTTQ